MLSDRILGRRAATAPQQQRATGMRRARRRAAAATELALVLPVFILLLVGILEFGRAVMVQQILVNGARETARRAILPGAVHSEVMTAANTYYTNASIPSTGRSIVLRGPNSTALTSFSSIRSGDAITSEVSIPYNNVSLGLGMWLKNKSMTARVTMRKE